MNIHIFQFNSKSNVAELNLNVITCQSDFIVDLTTFHGD